MPAYILQLVQTDKKTPSIAHARNGTDSLIFWPRLQTLCNMPTGNELYRRSSVVYTVPKKVDVSGVPTLAGTSIFDLSVKFSSNLTQLDMDTAFAEFKKLLALTDIQKLVTEQIRLTSGLTTV